MKLIQTSIVAGLAFFLSAGISFGAEMDDLDVTIRVVESDDITEMHNELSLPDIISVGELEHAENAEHGAEAGHDSSPEDNDEARDEHEDELEDHDEAREDRNDVDDEHDEATEEEKHEEDHEQAGR